MMILGKKEQVGQKVLKKSSAKTKLKTTDQFPTGPETFPTGPEKFPTGPNNSQPVGDFSLPVEIFQRRSGTVRAAFLKIFLVPVHTVQTSINRRVSL